MATSQALALHSARSGHCPARLAQLPQCHRAPRNKTDANTAKPRPETFPTKNPLELCHRDSQGGTGLRVRHRLWPQHVLDGGAQCSPNISSLCFLYYSVQVKDHTAPLCHGLACCCCTHLFQAELGWNSVFVDAIGEMTVYVAPRTHAIIQARTSLLGKSL